MRRVGWGSALVALALMLWVGWRWTAVPDASTANTPVPAPAATSVVVPAASTDHTATIERPVALTLTTRLLPDAGVSAVPGSVEIGLAQVAPEDAARHDALLLEEGAAARAGDFDELANVERWVAAAATAQPDGSVVVGPIPLPSADAYWVRARGADGLRYYAHRFTINNAPESIAPRIGAAIRVSREVIDDSRVAVFLRRRGATPEGPAWQALQSQFAPEVIEAFSDAPVRVDATVLLRPLEAQPLEVQVWVNGIEAQRQTVDLQAGRVHEVVLDAAAQAVARELAFDLELRVVDRDTQAPIPEVQVEMAGDQGLITKTSNRQGRVVFSDLDRRQAHRFTLLAKTLTNQRPAYPERTAIEVSATSDPTLSNPTPRLIKVTELTPLRWIDVRIPPAFISGEPRRGNPYPIFVLQRDVDGVWSDTPADQFLPASHGVAVSVDEPGRYRVAMAIAPWQVQYTSPALVEGPGPHRVSVQSSPAQDVQVQVMEAGVPLTGATVTVRGSLRGLPAVQVRTDAFGRFAISRATEPTVWIASDTYGDVAVDLSEGVRQVELVDGVAD